MNIKRLVLGTAAGALAVTGAQAADLPVVVEPVEYVRICDAYGAGFYYIPGTETCLRVAGRVRVDYQFFGDLDEDDFILSGLGYDDDADAGYRFRARAYVYMDSRTSTEFGLLRTYTELQFTRDNAGGVAVNLEEAFIQFGGLTFGRTRSFWDFIDAQFGSAFFFATEGSDRKINLAGYTAAFGNGFSASISVEDMATRSAGIFNTATGFGADQRVAWVPDLVANIRVDQGWGSAALRGAVGWREAGVFNGNGDFAESDSDVMFAVGAGVAVNVPFGNGTTIGLQGAYAHGGADYLSGDLAGYVFDGQYNPVSNDLDLYDGFSVAGGFSTNFTPAIAYSLGAGYAFIDTKDDLGDVNTVTIDSYLTYEVVRGFILGAGIQYKYVDTSDIGDDSALAGFLRAQRTF
ncbi:porin [Acuticoccus yangtzensis]|uniref:porin n=1 Tax=Acuticoccus yangtzensis TaxID=1443441 RepID=UPI0009496E5E|nr:porin [Acuticoccus yangtzensis]